MLYPTLWRGNRPSVWQDLFTARGDVDRVFDRIFNGSPSTMSVWQPSVDVRETGDGLVVSAELPGIRKEDVTVTVENGVLTISGEKTQEFQEGKEADSYHLVERVYGRFERSFALPRSVEQDSVKARFENGVLEIDLAKTPQAKPKQIEIK
jgi:HSP20 family protein